MVLHVAPTPPLSASRVSASRLVVTELLGPARSLTSVACVEETDPPARKSLQPSPKHGMLQLSLFSHFLFTELLFIFHPPKLMSCLSLCKIINDALTEKNQ